jgi:ribosomal protein L19E
MHTFAATTRGLRELVLQEYVYDDPKRKGRGNTKARVRLTDEVKQQDQNQVSGLHSGARDANGAPQHFRTAGSTLSALRTKNQPQRMGTLS